MTESERESIAHSIRNALGCGRELAHDYSAAIKDPPEIENGQIVIRNEDGRIVARVPESVLVVQPKEH
jgi:hypothetical protein